MRFDRFNLVWLILVICISTCKKFEEKAAVNTLNCENVSPTTALLTGIIVDEGKGISEFGFCWAKVESPQVSDSKIKMDQIPETGSEFSYTVTGLDPGTTYFARAYVISSGEEVYGDQISFKTTLIQIATLSTNQVSAITGTTAVTGGNITLDGGSEITSRGVCWSTNPDPTIELNTKTSDGTGKGLFTSNITGLHPGNTYYVRAYAVNSAGSAYGNQISFTTPPQSNIVFNPSKTYGSITDIDGNIYKTIQIGSQTWMAENLKTSRFDNGDALPSSYFACYDNNNSYNNDYGKLYNWYLIDDPRNLCPVGWHVPTETEWNVLRDLLGGANEAGGKMKESGYTHWTIPNTGADNESGFTGLPGGIMAGQSFFNWMTTSGWWWSSSYYPEFPEAISWGLDNSSNDLYRESAQYIGYGLSVRCIQGPRIITIPNLSRPSHGNPTATSVNVSAEIVAQGGSHVISRGFCWSIFPNPTTSDQKSINGAGTGSFSTIITGLQTGTRYYIRAYAINNAGTAYSNQVDITTLLTDRSGNNYNFRTIGTQTWMTENLKTTSLNDGTAIPVLSDNIAWGNTNSAAVCWYENQETTYKDAYGGLYNWYAVSSGRLCPSGWHVPTATDWETLIGFMGGTGSAGGALKESGYAHWQYPNTGATNSVGFTALPGGGRGEDGLYGTIQYYGNWWEANQYNATNAYYRGMHYDSGNIGRDNYSKKTGFSVRCLKD